jgi:hypothetical protein
VISVGVDRHALLGAEVVAPQVVEPVNMVGMRMGVEHGIDMLDPGGDHLLAEIRAGIDNDGGHCRHCRRTAAP